MSQEDQLERLRRLICRITYKDGFTLSADRMSEPTSVLISVSQRVKHVWTGEPISIGNCRPWWDRDLVRMSDAEVIKDVLFERVFALEKHEMEEWFKIDGVCVFDPHPKRT